MDNHYEDYIRSALEQGRSIEDIGNEFAKLLNDTNAKLQEEKRKAHEEEQRKAVENQKRADVCECIDSLMNTLAWYYPMYEGYSEEEVAGIAATLIKSCDLISKVHSTMDLHGDDILNILGVDLNKPVVEKDKGAEPSLDSLVKAFLGE